MTEERKKKIRESIRRTRERRFVGLDRPEGFVPMPLAAEVRVVKRLFDPLKRWVRVSFPPGLPLEESHAL